MAFSEQEFQQILQNQRNAGQQVDAPAAKPSKPKPRMNKWETQFADHLNSWSEARGNGVKWWAFEPVKLRLADKTYYSPDFMALGHDGSITFFEVKGFWRDDARVKIKVAAEIFPFPFVAVTKGKNGEWVYERFRGKQ